MPSEIVIIQGNKLDDIVIINKNNYFLKHKPWAFDNEPAHIDHDRNKDLVSLLVKHNYSRMDEKITKIPSY